MIMKYKIFEEQLYDIMYMSPYEEKPDIAYEFSTTDIKYRINQLYCDSLYIWE